MSSLLLASTLAHAASLGEWKRVNDKDLICTSAEYNGHLGDMDTAESCKNAVAALSPQLNSYAVWRGDTPRSGCHVCNLTGRGAPDTWTLTERVGAVSFLLSADDQRWKAQWEEDARIVGMAARVHKQVVAESRNVAAIAVRANRSLQRTLAVVRPANNNQTSYAGWRPTRHWTWTSGTIPLRYDIFSLVNLTWSWLTGNGAPPGGGEGIVVAPARRRRQLATHHHKDACCDAWVARGPAALVRCHELRNRTMPSMLSLTNSSMALVSLSVDARAVVATGRDARPFDDRLAVSDFAQAHGLAHLTPRECMDEEDLAGLSWISPSWARVYVLSACRAAHPQVERFVWLDALSLPPRLPSVTHRAIRSYRGSPRSPVCLHSSSFCTGDEPRRASQTAVWTRNTSIKPTLQTAQQALDNARALHDMTLMAVHEHCQGGGRCSAALAILDAALTGLLKPLGSSERRLVTQELARLQNRR